MHSYPSILCIIHQIHETQLLHAEMSSEQSSRQTGDRDRQQSNRRHQPLTCRHSHQLLEWNHHMKQQTGWQQPAGQLSALWGWRWWWRRSEESHLYLQTETLHRSEWGEEKGEGRGSLVLWFCVKNRGTQAATLPVSPFSVNLKPYVRVKIGKIKWILMELYLGIYLDIFIL